MTLMEGDEAFNESSRTRLEALGCSPCCSALSPCLSTLSQSSTLATNHYKKSQLFIVASLTGPVLLIFQGAVPRPSASHFQDCQSSRRPNLSSPHQADISLNINDSFYVWQQFIRRRDAPNLFSCADLNTTAKTFELELFLVERK